MGDLSQHEVARDGISCELGVAQVPVAKGGHAAAPSHRRGANEAGAPLTNMCQGAEGGASHCRGSRAHGRRVKTDVASQRKTSQQKGDFCRTSAGVGDLAKGALSPKAVGLGPFLPASPD